MSRELIVALRRDAAFDPTPLPTDLAALHVPFDSLVGNHQVEQRLNDAAQAIERIAVVGAMGAGKSSVLPYTLTPERGFAPLPISVSPESDETVTDPGSFAQHVVRVISIWAAIARSAAEHLEALKRLARLIRAIELEPVLVIDDSDRWLRRGARDRVRSRGPRELPRVAGVPRNHAGGAQRPRRRAQADGRRAAREHPRPPRSRVCRHGEFHRADGGQSLRTTLEIVHTAVTEAALAEHDRIGAGLIDAAIAAWGPPPS